jgi:hypothetical protein
VPHFLDPERARRKSFIARPRYEAAAGVLSAVDHALVHFRVAGALGLDVCVLDLAEVVGREVDSGGGDVLFQPV